MRFQRRNWEQLRQTSPTTKLVMTVILLFGVAFPSRSIAQETKMFFSMRKGINVAGPFVRVKPAPENPDGQISGFWTLERYSDWYTGEDLRRAGFDFVRLPINPAVFLENPPAVRARLFDEVEEGVRFYLSAGLRVVFDLHFWNPPNKTWTEQSITARSDTAAFAAYRELIGEISLRLDKYPHGDVAFELLNEPSLNNCKTGWILMQQALLREVRKRAPVLPVVVTGCGGQLDGLLALDRSQIDMTDKNLIYTFHFYEPFLFTHQGGYRYFLYIEGVPYPATAGSLSTTLDLTTRAIDQSDLSTVDSLAAKSYATKEVAHYFAQAPNQAFIDQRFDKVIAWSHANGISASQILLGEFAAMNWRKTDRPDYRQARRVWDEDVQSSADKRGIAGAFWSLPYPKGPLFR
jgi:endoglucanase